MHWEQAPAKKRNENIKRQIILEPCRNPKYPI